MYLVKIYLEQNYYSKVFLLLLNHYLMIEIITKNFSKAMTTDMAKKYT